MTMKLSVALLASLLLAACSSKPSETDIASFLNENLPTQFKTALKLDQITSETNSAGDEVTVKFKAQLKLTQPLFEGADFEVVAKSQEFDVSGYSEIERRSKELTDQNLAAVSAAIQPALAKTEFIKETSPADSVSEWYGSFKSKKVVDKWVSSDFRTDIPLKLSGKPRAEFSEAATPVSRASGWFAAMKTSQGDALAKIGAAKILQDKDVEIAQGKAEAEQVRKEKDAAIAQAERVSEQERQAKEKAMAAHQKLLRKMPVEITTRNALVGGTIVLRIQSQVPMTINLTVERGLQKHSRDLQLAANKVLEYGHAEGWGFKSGDVVTISNPAFDPFGFGMR